MTHTPFDDAFFDSLLYPARPVKPTPAPTPEEVAAAMRRVLQPGQEAVLIGGNEAAMHEAGFEILPSPAGLRGFLIVRMPVA